MDTNIWLVTVPNNVADRIYAKIPGAVQRNVSTLNEETATFMGPPDVHPASVPCDTNATISFTFNGTDYTLQPKHYLAHIAPDQCMSLVLGWTRGVLGTPFMQSVYTSFRSSPKQVGFAAVSPTAADKVQSSSDGGSINGNEDAKQSSGSGGNASVPANAASQSSAQGSGAVTGKRLSAAGVVLAVAAIAVSVL